MTNKKKLFGTDGIRGKANNWPLNKETLSLIAKHACLHLKRLGTNEPIIVIGYDTRESCGAIFDALVKGFESISKAKIVSIGVVPTPAVAFYARELRADFGVMISASHNPYQDNGIKFFDMNGQKLSDDIQGTIEESVFEAMDKSETIEVTDKNTSDVNAVKDVKEYEEFLINSLGKQKPSFKKFKVVIDCANGSGYEIAPRILTQLGAEVIAIGADPDGRNINENCGAVHTQLLQKTVQKENADLGLALDGDADRLIVVDEKGNVIDGDQIMGAFALSLKKQGQLNNNALVVTLMTNMGLDAVLKDEGIETIRTQIGDRYVMKAIQDNDASLGGEQSGHMIFANYSLSGDGILAGLQVLKLLLENDQTTSQALHSFEPYLQLKENITYDLSMGMPLDDEEVQSLIKNIEKDLEQKGARLLVRASGTEPKIRILMESKTLDNIEKPFESLKTFIQQKSA